MARRRHASSQLHFVRDEVRLPGVLALGRYQYAASRAGLPPHAHPQAVEICFLERGEQTYRVRDRLYHLRGNDQFFTRPGEVHDTARFPEERGILYWLLLRLETPNFLGLSSLPAKQLRREISQMPTRHFRADPESARILGEITDLILRAQSSRRWEAAASLRLQLLMLDYLTRTAAASRRGARGNASPLMQRVLQYIERHLSAPIHVPRLAEVARLSESRFKIRFKEEMGVPPAEFWLRKKIEKAVVCLRDQPVTEVAFELGFSSSQYFATVFKRYLLASPSQFRGPKKPRLKTASRSSSAGPARKTGAAASPRSVSRRRP
jgi:AraC-like DNA-binding protein